TSMNRTAPVRKTGEQAAALRPPSDSSRRTSSDKCRLATLYSCTDSSHRRGSGPTRDDQDSRPSPKNALIARLQLRRGGRGVELFGEPTLLASEPPVAPTPSARWQRRRSMSALPPPTGLPVGAAPIPDSTTPGEILAQAEALRTQAARLLDLRKK